MQLRLAERSELQWVNERYDEVEFIHSKFDNEVIAIAELDGQKAGIGRLVIIDDYNAELGGMYVLEAFREKGIAKEIVKFLLTHAKPSQTIYCIPFEHLVPFYMRCGFTTCADFKSVPEEILEKYHWCKSKYFCSTALLLFQPDHSR